MISWRRIFASSEFVDKRKGTQDNERQALNRWSEYLGFVRVDQITPALIKTYIDKRRKERSVRQAQVGGSYRPNNKPRTRRTA